MALGPGMARRVCESESGAFGRRVRTRGKRVTCREGKLDLLLDHLEGHKVMLFVETPVVQQQPVTLLGGKPERELGIGAGNGAPTWMPAAQPPH